MAHQRLVRKDAKLLQDGAGAAGAGALFRRQIRRRGGGRRSQPTPPVANPARRRSTGAIALGNRPIHQKLRSMCRTPFWQCTFAAVTAPQGPVALATARSSGAAFNVAGLPLQCTLPPQMSPRTARFHWHSIHQELR